jgi:hypothetical protein
MTAGTRSDPSGHRPEKYEQQPLDVICGLTALERDLMVKQKKSIRGVLIAVLLCSLVGVIAMIVYIVDLPPR